MGRKEQCLVTVEQAKALQPEYVVVCPEDRGEPQHAARVKHVSQDVQKNFKGVEYVWVTVQDAYVPSLGRNKHRHVWPSNRLLQF